jgi:hypothetical protein
MKPGRVKVVVVAATAVEGADVREGEAVTGVGVVVAEDATKITPRNASTQDSGGFALCRHSSHRQKQLPVNFIGTTQCSAHLRPGLQIHARTNNQAAHIDRRFISMGAAGWHICFDVLDHLLSGTPIGRIVGPEAMKVGGWQRLNAEYARQFAMKV